MSSAYKQKLTGGVYRNRLQNRECQTKKRSIRRIQSWQN